MHLHLSVPEDFHHALKEMARKSGKTMSELVISSLSCELKKDCELCQKYPNLSKETLKSIQDSEKGIGVKEFGSVEEMFEHLKI
ncbi:MAG: hypothetical protein HQM08_29725 [Candidatus Riflebacteria bacterium]|nr:hypothetical protein [Candidatus Riflebacteria bacterium]